MDMVEAETIRRVGRMKQFSTRALKQLVYTVFGFYWLIVIGWITPAESLAYVGPIWCFEILAWLIWPEVYRRRNATD